MCKAIGLDARPMVVVVLGIVQEICRIVVLLAIPALSPIWVSADSQCAHPRVQELVVLTILAYDQVAVCIVIAALIYVVDLHARW